MTRSKAMEADRREPPCHPGPRRDYRRSDDPDREPLMDSVEEQGGQGPGSRGNGSAHGAVRQQREPFPLGRNPTARRRSFTLGPHLCPQPLAAHAGRVASPSALPAATAVTNVDHAIRVTTMCCCA